jgi:hypothetical protein
MLSGPVSQRWVSRRHTPEGQYGETIQTCSNGSNPCKNYVPIPEKSSLILRDLEPGGHILRTAT